MQNVEIGNEKRELQTAMPSMPSNENTTLPARTQKQENKIFAVSKDIRIAVSLEQYETVREAHKDSLKLLDSCGNALLSAMQLTLPPPETGQRVGDYTGMNLRQMAKSVCDLIQTKTGVVRSMYQISRDEI